MEKAREFLNIFDNSHDYREKFLSLYNGLYILLKDNIWARIEEEGIEKGRMKDALLYLREDEEMGGKTVLGESELLILRDLLFRLISG